MDADPLRRRNITFATFCYTIYYETEGLKGERCHSPIL